VLALTGLVACGHESVPPRPPPGPPRLVVLLVIDQLPQWAFAAKRPHFTGGFDRLLREGEWHTGQHPSPATSTAVGHALLGTGEPPTASGIIGNEWWDRDAQRHVGSVENPGSVPSAHRLRVPALGDAIAAANAGGKAVGVSLKDRAAILPIGKAGTSIWYDWRKVSFVANRPLAWLDGHNRAHPITPHLRDVWTPLDPVKIAKLAGVADDRPGEVGELGFGGTFPHDLGTNKNAADALITVPLGNTLALEVAAAAITGEQLGADAIPDLLVVSLSVNDYVGHGWGHESWESWDEMLRLDADLATFLAVLDTKVGAGRWAMIATSDHGAAPMPAAGGWRMTYEQMQAAANAAASAELGPGEWISSAKYPTVYLSAAARAQPDRERAIAIKKIIFALRSFPGIERVERTADFAGNCDQRTGDAFMICLMLDPERSGEILFMPRKGWIFEKETERMATSHGSWHDYDREVPVIMLAPGRKPHEPLAKPSAAMIQMVRISTLLARWLGVTPPVAMPRSPK
jgi:predicted AlkP superfamily pyrophosphatase or phosphodiesterase